MEAQQKSVMGAKKLPSLFSCPLKHKTSGEYSVFYFRHLHKNLQIILTEEKGGDLKSAH